MVLRASLLAAAARRTLQAVAPAYASLAADGSGSGSSSWSSDDDDGGNCTDIGSHPDACEWVTQHCQDEPACSGGLLDYLSLRYCHGDPALTLVGLILWLLLLISVLATTADNFFVPQLQVMSDKLHLRPEVAGITLLAIGNGAPDVFGAVSAITDAKDFPLALGALLGASFLISTVVLGGVLLVSPPDTEVNRNYFLRDVLVYIAATVCIFAIAADGQIKLYEACSLLVFYVAYVSLVIWTTREKPSEVGTSSLVASHDRQLQISESLLSEGEGSFLTEASAVGGSGRSSTERDGGGGGPDYLVGLTWEPESNILCKVQFVAEWPFSVARWLSIPAAEGHWSRRHRMLAACAPLGTSLIILLDGPGTDAFSNPPVVAPVLGAASVLSALVWFTSNDKTLPTYHFGLVLLGFASTIAWLDIVANEVVAVLEAFGIMVDVSTSILGLTVLAMGNSIGDFVADTVVARAGSPHMGIASCFGSPLLNDVVGLGVSLTVVTASDGTLTAKLDPQCRLAYVFLWISLCSSLAAFTATGFKTPPKAYAIYLFVLYAVFMMLSCLIEADVIKIF